MARKKANYPLVERLEIVDIAAEGKALGRWNDIVVFVPMAVPGDVVDVQIRSKRRRFMEGYIVNYVKKSPLREEPVCEHYGTCGGCKWQHLPYSEQLRFKQQQVADQLGRIGKIELPAVSPILGSAKTLFYRNKLEFTFSNKRWLTAEEITSGDEIADSPALGFHIPNLFDKVLDIRKCWLQDDPSNPIRLAVREFCLENGYSFYNIREHKGLMRNLIVRTSTTGEVMAIVVFGENDPQRIDALLQHTAEKFPQITSLMYVVNTKLNDTIGDLDILLYKGNDHIFEQMEGLRFKIGPKSFYQTNSLQAYELYKIARDFAALTGAETVYDLYTGTGTIANFVARQCRKVVGVEYVPEAIEDAKVNARLNGIGNAVFYAGDMKDVLNERFIAENGRPDVVILDPPRAGIHEDVARTILTAAPARIVYVSCNPATQARDVALLDGAYRVTKIQPVDMFPHTHHVENVVQLMRRCNV
ncbi:23S rRNA (uracil-C(5))-methyltransferase RlmCD [Alistipes sp. cv1]|nr:23S rRNA (uracil-C(5))-methyltransferase RlmCD [Faecalibacterium prausnitzii]